MRRLSRTSTFKQDYKRVTKRGLPESELRAVITALVEERPLSLRHRDHMLTGIYKAHRECHIRPDWLLIYRIEPLIGDPQFSSELVLIRTGSHSDLFDE